MKILFISLIFISSLYSQFIVITYDTNDEDVCVPTQEDLQDYGPYYFLTNIPNYGAMIIYKSSISQIKDGYDINPKTGRCELISEINKDNTDKFMGMKETDFNLAMALWGVCLSFLMSIGLIISF